MSSEDPGQKFLGCLVSVRCKPKYNGAVDIIIGTVQAIGRKEHTITLTNGLLNGIALPDDHVIMAEEIASLELMHGITDEDSIANNILKEDLPSEPEPEPPEISTSLNNLTLSESQPKYKNFQEFTSAFTSEFASTLPVRVNVSKNNDCSSSATTDHSTKVLSSSLPVISTPTNTTAAVVGGGGDKVNGPDIVYSASTFESSYKAKEKRRSAFNAYSPNNNNNLNQTSTPIIQQKNTVLASTQNMVLARLGLMNNNATSAAIPIPSVVPSHSSSSSTRTHAKIEKTPTKPFQFLKQGQNGQYSQQQLDRSPRTKVNQLKNDEAFEMTVAEIKAEEYDFEENLAKFDKLPVGNIQKPVAIPKTPHFKSSDTTLQANRAVDSIKLKNVTVSKLFTTDTGVIIPALDVNLRNKILNMAHQYGLTHTLMVEVFGRAVAQVCLPLLGDSYRLSPERVNDRPSVLVCTGPNWQGAAGICAARILATQGVMTVLYTPKEETGICKKEESLYTLTDQIFTRNLKDVQKRKYDLVILAMDDQQTAKFSFDPSKLPLQNTEVVLIDPPLVNSYSKALTANPSRMGAGIGLSKMYIVSPLLPLAYQTDSKLKLFLVNLGVPSGIFKMNNVDYKSPFGDKLTVQIFPKMDHEDLTSFSLIRVHFKCESRKN